MSKDDWIWVAVRIFGIYLIVLAITSVPPLVMNAYTLFQNDVSKVDALVDQDISSGVDTVDKIHDLIFQATAASLTNNIVRVVLFCLIGFYFLRHGKLFFRLISRK